MLSANTFLAVERRCYKTGFCRLLQNPNRPSRRSCSNETANSDTHDDMRSSIAAARIDGPRRRGGRHGGV